MHTIPLGSLGFLALAQQGTRLPFRVLQWFSLSVWRQGECLLFEIVFYSVVLAGLELTQTRLTLEVICLCLLSAGIKGVQYHAWHKIGIFQRVTGIGEVVKHLLFKCENLI